jgi:hypothetical protein
MDEPHVADIVATFHTERTKRLEKDFSSPYIRNQLIASDLMDCRRYHIFGIVCGELKPPPDPQGREIIQEGNRQEDTVLNDMRKEGWEIVEQQVRSALYGNVNGKRRLICTGRADGKMRRPEWPRGVLYTFDVKSTSGYRFDSINHPEDFLKDLWLRKWYRQAQTYCLSENVETFFFILSNCRGGRKIIPIPIDWEMGEEILKLCEWTMQWVEEIGEDKDNVDTILMQGGVPYHDDFSTCQKCDWFRVACFPPEPATAEGVPIKDYLDCEIDAHQALQSMARNYQRIDRRLMEESRGHAMVLAGKWVIEGKQRGKGWTKTIRKAGR